jgi:hypothetical protein
MKKQTIDGHYNLKNSLYIQAVFINSSNNNYFEASEIWKYISGR